LGKRENSPIGRRGDENSRSLQACCTYVRDGKIVLEQSEFIDGDMTIDELIKTVKRFEDLGIELFEIRIGFGQEDD
jgi:hypothetical protein